MFPLFAIVVVVVGGGPGDLLTDIVREVVVGEEVGVVVVVWRVVVVSGAAVDLDVCSAIFQQNIVSKIERYFVQIKRKVY